MNMTTKQEIFEVKLKEYLKGTKAEKSAVLDTVCSVIHCHRKAAIRRFRTLQMRGAMKKKTGRPKLYTREDIAGLVRVWELFHQVCAERFHPSIHVGIAAMKYSKVWRYGSETEEHLLKMSLGSVKKHLLGKQKLHGRSSKGATKPSELKEIIPIRRGPWDNPPPGKGEIDTVAHCGLSLQGDYAYSTQYTDVTITWTCLAAQWNKGEAATLASISGFTDRLPWKLLAIDPDSGTEFINWKLKGWCDAHGIEMTRSRPYMKNDHGRIEQKNYVNVRQFVGYCRYDHADAVAVMNELYRYLEDYLNFFINSMKCISKVRVNSKYIRTYDKPQTAYQRALNHPEISENVKEVLRQKYATLNLVELKQKIDHFSLVLKRNQWSKKPRLR